MLPVGLYEEFQAIHGFRRSNNLSNPSCLYIGR
jgi:hypothetical protein